MKLKLLNRFAVKTSQFLVLLATMFSCSENRLNDCPYSFKEYYEDGMIKELFCFQNDTSKDSYLYQRYNEKGILIDSFFVEEHKIIGVRKVYIPPLPGYSYCTYAGGKISGEVKAFYNNGVIAYQGFQEDTVRVNSWKYYDQDGKINEYIYYNLLGEILKYRKYDKKQNVVNNYGSAFVGFKMKPFKKDYELGEYVKLEYHIALPPNCISEVNIEIRTKDFRKTFTRKEAFAENTNCVEFELINPGDQFLFVTYNIIDTLTSFSEKDSAVTYLGNVINLANI